MLAETEPEPPRLRFAYLRRIADALGPHAIQPAEQAAPVGLFRDKLTAELDGLWNRPPGPVAPARTGGVFVSYRRKGTAHIASRQLDVLDRALGLREAGS
jgi:hypothetical protein